MGTKPYVWQAVKEAVEQSQSEIVSYNEIRRYIAIQYKEVKTSTINPQIIACSVNHPSRVHYPLNSKPRIANREHDFLFNVGRGMVTLYIPGKHGIWCITYSDDGKPAVAKLDNNEGEIVFMPKPTHTNSNTKTRRKSRNPEVLTPSKEELLHYNQVWNTLENYRLQENALDKLFSTTYPKNNDIEDVLIKVASLNDFYSTNIFSVFPVAKHIVSLNIDERLSKGDEYLVDEIAVNEMKNGTPKNFYSFATKYCSHHNPLAYPIYDSYVDKVLRYFRDVDGFSSFENSDLRNYVAFKDILIRFREFYNLTAYTLKDIDRYLWLLGKEKLPQKNRKG